MHDRPDHDSMNQDAHLRAALRALPTERPPEDGWPALARRARRRRAARRITWTALPAALAAGVALALLWPRAPLQSAKPASTPVARQSAAMQPRAPTANSLAALQASSRQWQHWVQTLDDNGAPLNGRALAEAVSVQDRIALIDLQLSATHDPATLDTLWRQRISLLQRLGLLHLAPHTVAARSDAATLPTIPM